ncbi:hypothetical protein LDO26_14485 [Luteimonas sp. BDR2-5]|uniref:hypothetical protein n=1 Tax=Proluteimonas luteida TaxID=2878685 RepID=UPI001E2B4211|nr:hypothetical protein [Luteimonas sp. BDR2-5]MCD9029399.1 hypothetical protein [Luteimonas sp. BDR2-5]
MARRSAEKADSRPSADEMSTAVFGHATEDVLGVGSEAAKTLHHMDHLFRAIGQECEHRDRWSHERVKALAEIGQWYAERMGDHTACEIDEMRAHAVRAGGAA